jgi:hypothetical protein
MSMHFNRYIFKADFTLISGNCTVLKNENKNGNFLPKDRSAAQPNVVKENSADRHPVVQLTSP